MTPNLDQERVERAAEAMHSSQPWSSFWSLDDARLLARAAITAYLGDTHVVVPREALSYARQMSNFCFNAKQLDRFDEKARRFMDQMQSGFDRAMLSAELTEGDRR